MLHTSIRTLSRTSPIDPEILSEKIFRKREFQETHELSLVSSQDVWRCVPGVQLTGLTGDICLLSPGPGPGRAPHITHPGSALSRNTGLIKRKEDAKTRSSQLGRDCNKDCYECDSFRGCQLGQSIIFLNYLMN